MKKDQDKTKEQLITELKEMRQRVVELEASEVEHKQAETIPSAAEEDYLRMFALFPIGITVLDMKGVILYCNSAVYNEGGYAEGEFTGKHFSKIASVRLKDIPVFIRVFNSVIRRKIPKPFETIYQRKDGTTGWTELHIGLTKLGGKRRILVIQHDITERKQAEEALRESQEKHRAIFEQAADSIVLVDAKTGALVEFNERACQNLGYSPEELGKLKIPDFEVTESAEKVKKHIQKIVKEGSDVFETRHRTKEGEIRDIWVSSRAINIGERGFVQSVWRDITERKRAEERLQQSEENLMAYLESAPDGIYINDLKGVFLYGNKKAEEITGYKREELMGKSFFKLKLLLGKHLAKAGKLLALNAMGKPTGPDEFEMIIKDGSHVWVEINTTPIKQQESTVVIGFVRDITERRRAGKALLESEAHLARSQRIAHLGNWDLNVKANISLLSDEYYRIFGLSPREIGFTQEEFLSHVHPDDREFVQRKTAESLYQSAPHSIDYRIILPDGSERVVHSDAEVLFDEAGEPIRMFGIIQDITERKQAEENLQEAAERFRRLFEQSNDAVFIHDLEGKLLDVNSKACDMLGYDKDTLLKVPVPALHPEEELPASKKALQTTMETGSIRFESKFKKADGTIIDVDISSSLIDPEGGIVQGIVRDITEHKQAEEREKQLQQELILTSRLATVGEMAAGIAHEINNPLTGVIGFSSLLLKKDIPEGIRKDVNIIHDGAQRIAGVTGRMLSYTRQYKLERTSANVNDIIETTLAMRAYEMKSSDIQVETRLDPDLPITIADAGQLQQVFLNIILNAEAEMIQAHGRGNLLVKTERIDNTIRVSFKDDGPGIAKKDLDKIFNPFFTTREVGKGAGLGLSVCHGIVAKHGGKIYAQSKLGKGATFFVELPIVTKAEQLKLAEPVLGEPKRISGARILVVDDEPIVQQFLTEVLGEEGHEVEIVDNSEDALGKLGSEDYDVILLDVKLPGISGIEIYKQLQKKTKSLARRALFITGDTMGRDTMSFLSRTKASYITKPFDAEQLKKEIDRILTEGA